MVETAYEATSPEFDGAGFVKKKAVEYSTTDARKSFSLFGPGGLIDTRFYENNALHQITEVDATNGANGANRTYNRSGNITQNEKGELFEYDYANRLVKVRTKDSSNNPIDVIFTYDATGRNIQKQVIDVTTQNITTQEDYYYSGLEIIAEYDASQNLKRSFVLGERIDIPILVNENNADYYFVFDTQGSVISITNSSGTVVEKFKYDAHGNYAVVLDSPLIENKLFYNAIRFEKEIGLYNNRARFYDPIHGSFIQRDPMGYVDGSNLYLYSSGNSVNYTDPLGLDDTKEVKEPAKPKKIPKLYEYNFVDKDKIYDQARIGLFNKGKFFDIDFDKPYFGIYNEPTEQGKRKWAEDLVKDGNIFAADFAIFSPLVAYYEANKDIIKMADSDTGGFLGLNSDSFLDQYMGANKDQAFAMLNKTFIGKETKVDIGLGAIGVFPYKNDQNYSSEIVFSGFFKYEYNHKFSDNKKINANIKESVMYAEGKFINAFNLDLNMEIKGLNFGARASQEPRFDTTYDSFFGAPIDTSLYLKYKIAEISVSRTLGNNETVLKAEVDAFGIYNWLKTKNIRK